MQKARGDLLEKSYPKLISCQSDFMVPSYDPPTKRQRLFHCERCFQASCPKRWFWQPHAGADFAIKNTLSLQQQIRHEKNTLKPMLSKSNLQGVVHET